MATKRELSNAVKLSVLQLVFVPILTYGQESRLMTETMLSQVQAAEMGFFAKSSRCDISRQKMPNKVGICEIRKTLNIELLL